METHTLAYNATDAHYICKRNNVAEALFVLRLHVCVHKLTQRGWEFAVNSPCSDAFLRRWVDVFLFAFVCVQLEAFLL